MDLNKVFYPKSIAVVGASTKPGSVGNDIVRNLAQQGFAGKVFPVNPKATELYALPCYPNLSAIGQPVDLMVIVVPAAIVPTILEEGGKLGIKGAIIISAGFKEVGQLELEKQIEAICVKNDITLIGPNCLGVINPEIKMNASFAALMPSAGSVAFISQSGALCTAVLDYAQKLNLGFSKFMSIGNKAIVDELEVLEYLSKDEKTRVIALYAEQLEKSQELIAMIKKITREPEAKPVIVLKSGRTSAGASASASHTGALAGNDSAYEALFRQSGAIRAYSVSEFFDYIQIFVDNPFNPAKNVAVITNAGGPGVLAADEIITSGLNLASLSDKTTTALKQVLPACSNFHNPIDILGDAPADRYAQALEIAAADPNIDSLLVILTPQSMTEIEATAQAIKNIKDKCRKPIAVSFMGEETVRSGVEIMRNGSVANFLFPEQASRSLSIMERFQTGTKKIKEKEFAFTDIDKTGVRAIFDKAKQAGQHSFPESQALEILSLYNFPVLNSCLVHNVTEAVAAATKINGRIALKIVSPDILHKNDVGGVTLDVEPADVAKKYEEMMSRVAKNKPGAKLEGALIVEMIPHGAEVILGSSRDANLGNMIMVGLGGIYVEILKDVVFGLSPLTAFDARQMIDSIKAKKIFAGVRGQEPSDVEALVDCLGRLSQLLTDFPEIKELDINPLRLLASGQGARVLDARIVID